MKFQKRIGRSGFFPQWWGFQRVKEYQFLEVFRMKFIETKQEWSDVVEAKKHTFYYKVHLLFCCLHVSRFSHPQLHVPCGITSIFIWVVYMYTSSCRTARLRTKFCSSSSQPSGPLHVWNSNRLGRKLQVSTPLRNNIRHPILIYLSLIFILGTSSHRWISSLWSLCCSRRRR